MTDPDSEKDLSKKDSSVLSTVIENIVSDSYGTVFVEVWISCSYGDPRLYRPNGGRWMDPAFLQSSSNPEEALNLKEVALDCPLGVDLAGTMYKEATSPGGRSVQWRQIKSIVDDPFIQKSWHKRAERIFELGIGYVGAISFSVRGRDGIVLFMAPSSAGFDCLCSNQNEKFLLSATDLIGAAYAIRLARREIHAKMGDSLADDAVGEEVAVGTDQENPSPNAMDPIVPSNTQINDDEIKTGRKTFPCHCMCDAIRSSFRKFDTSRRKWKGVGLHAPPRQSLFDSIFIFLGCFVTMLSLLRFNELLSDGPSGMMIHGGWYASTLCITFALTSAPVGQPFHIISAHIWNVLVGILVRQIPSNANNFMEEDGNYIIGDLPLDWRLALAVGLGVSGQAFLGIIHPPASGLSFVFAAGNILSWDTLLGIILTDILLVTMCVVLLNLSEAKQYPTYWWGANWNYPEGKRMKNIWDNTLKNWTDPSDSLTDATTLRLNESLISR